MKRLYQVTNALQPEIEETRGIEALAQISQVSYHKNGAVYPKSRFQIQSQTAKRQTSKRHIATLALEKRELFFRAAFKK